jgi:hypothetical protein
MVHQTATDLVMAAIDEAAGNQGTPSTRAREFSRYPVDTIGDGPVRPWASKCASTDTL